jgi:hypothetical protein
VLPRIRTIKPEFFRHEGLYDLEIETQLPIRLAFAGLWTCCDREGRFVWRPRELKAVIMPHDLLDFSRVLDALLTRGFVVKYACLSENYGYIPTWKKHQFVNGKEASSVLPAPDGNDTHDLPFDGDSASVSRGSRVGHAIGDRPARERERELKILRTPQPPAKRGEIQIFEWARQKIEVQMGRHHRLPNLSAYQGALAQVVVEALIRKGFAARICPPGAGEKAKEA